MTDRPAYLLLLARASERHFSNYVAALPALHQRHGGRFTAMAAAPMVEQFGHQGAAHAVMVSCWPTRDHLIEFWQHPKHAALLKHFAADGLMAAALEGQPVPPMTAHTAALAVFLGPGPTPALLEAAGAQALALVRERQIEPLHGLWVLGDVAIYRWASDIDARQQLASFSSGQRGRAMLLSGLQSGPRQETQTRRFNAALPSHLLQAS